MLNLYRRHTARCPHRDKGQYYTKCSCPIWCDGRLNGKRIRQSLGLRDWRWAVKRLERWEQESKLARAARTVSDAIESYLGDCKARKLADSTVYGYRKVLTHLEAFCGLAGVQFIEDLDLATISDFRASREIASTTSRMELEVVRSFCDFAVERGWMEKNHARQLKHHALLWAADL
jgi:hypothetical protein